MKKSIYLKLNDSKFADSINQKMQSQNKIDEVISMFDETEQIQETFSKEEEADNFIKIAVYFSKDLKTLFNQLRFVLKQNELSARGMRLTEIITGKVPNHYAAWLYRKDYLLKFKTPTFLKEEKDLTIQRILAEPKGFQSWDHLRFVFDLIGIPDYKDMVEFMSAIYTHDSRNYHAWVFRTWYVKRFNLFNEELDYIDKLLPTALLNNSLWCYRHFLAKEMKLADEQEIVFIWKILNDNNLTNESVWAYFDSVFEKTSGFSDDLNAKLQTLISENKQNRFVYKSLIFNEMRKKKEDWNVKLIQETIKELIEKHDQRRSAFWIGFENNFVV